VSAAKANTIGEQQLKQVKLLVQHIFFNKLPINYYYLRNIPVVELVWNYRILFYTSHPLVTHVQISSHSHH